MATSLGTGRRGRPMGEIRKFAQGIAPTVTQSDGDKKFSIVVGKTAAGRPDKLEENLPNNSVIVPVELTQGKNHANAFEQLRLGISDAGFKGVISVLSLDFLSGNEGDKERTKMEVFYLAKKAPKSKAKVEPKNQPKPRARAK